MHDMFKHNLNISPTPSYLVTSWRFTGTSSDVLGGWAVWRTRQSPGAVAAADAAVSLCGGVAGGRRHLRHVRHAESAAVRAASGPVCHAAEATAAPLFTGSLSSCVHLRRAACPALLPSADGTDAPPPQQGRTVGGQWPRAARPCALAPLHWT